MNTEPINGNCPVCESDLVQGDDGEFFCPDCGEIITDKDAQIRLLQQAIAAEQEFRDELAAVHYKAEQEIERLRSELSLAGEPAKSFSARTYLLATSVYYFELYETVDDSTLPAALSQAKMLADEMDADIEIYEYRCTIQPLTSFTDNTELENKRWLQQFRDEVITRKLVGEGELFTLSLTRDELTSLNQGLNCWLAELRAAKPKIPGDMPLTDQSVEIAEGVCRRVDTLLGII